VPPSVSPAGAQGGTSACSTGAALSFVSCIALFGGAAALLLGREKPTRRCRSSRHAQRPNGTADTSNEARRPSPVRRALQAESRETSPLLTGGRLRNRWTTRDPPPTQGTPGPLKPFVGNRDSPQSTRGCAQVRPGSTKPVIPERPIRGGAPRDPTAAPAQIGPGRRASLTSTEHSRSAAKRCPRPFCPRGHRAAPQLAVRVPP